MRVCFEIFMRLSVRFVWRKEGKNEAFSMRASRSSFSNLLYEIRKRMKEHNFVSFFDERKKLIINRSSKKSCIKKRATARLQKEENCVFFVQRTTFLFSAAIFFLLLTRSVKSLSVCGIISSKKILLSS